MGSDSVQSHACCPELHSYQSPGEAVVYSNCNLAGDSVSNPS